MVEPRMTWKSGGCHCGAVRVMRITLFDGEHWEEHAAKLARAPLREGG